MHERGFTLIEVLVAMALLTVAALGGLQLVIVATEMMRDARTQSLAANVAASRLEQLRGLRFEYDGAGVRVTDTSTDLSRDPPVPGGTGLRPSGAATLDANVAGYVDFLDSRGRWVGNGPAVPPGAAVVRRWAVEAVDASGDLLALQVLARPVTGGRVGAGARVAGEARFVTLRARVLR